MCNILRTEVNEFLKIIKNKIAEIIIFELFNDQIEKLPFFTDKNYIVNIHDFFVCFAAFRLSFLTPASSPITAISVIFSLQLKELLFGLFQEVFLQSEKRNQ